MSRGLPAPLRRAPLAQIPESIFGRSFTLRWNKAETHPCSARCALDRKGAREQVGEGQKRQDNHQQPGDETPMKSGIDKANSTR